ncbi:hypothetical protein [Halolamina sp.]|jgi:fructose-1,6-bisphosphatase/inositol monophosphatase family enzyme|uniref:hypothetical protein n=1 Tax=Halolamina sp. TaxID=1940283 RepID=UPI000223B5CE|nr:hypothetical protein Halar_1136 [halophilic archaeon DL31]
MDQRLRKYGSLVGSVVLVVVGTLATGILPATVPYQLLAGAIIVAGFGLGYIGLDALGVD